MWYTIHINNKVFSNQPASLQWHWFGERSLDNFHQGAKTNRATTRWLVQSARKTTDPNTPNANGTVGRQCAKPLGVNPGQHCLIAQLVEHPSYTRVVLGSSPSQTICSLGELPSMPKGKTLRKAVNIVCVVSHKEAAVQNTLRI